MKNNSIEKFRDDMYEIIERIRTDEYDKSNIRAIVNDFLEKLKGDCKGG
jgi:vacuolar-type H+-ATPase subunit E/Vma4